MKEIHNRSWIFDAAQTDKALLHSDGSALMASDEKMAITYCKAVCARSNTVNVSVMVAFAASTIPTITVNSSNGQPDFALNHGGIAPGGGEVNGTGEAAIATGAAGVGPRLTCSVPTGGDLRIILSYILLDAEVVT
jgi:hypothetical protein